MFSWANWANFWAVVAVLGRAVGVVAVLFITATLWSVFWDTVRIHRHWTRIQRQKREEEKGKDS